nr:sortase [Chloroflexota bacterium]
MQRTQDARRKRAGIGLVLVGILLLLLSIVWYALTPSPSAKGRGEFFTPSPSAAASVATLIPSAFAQATIRLAPTAAAIATELPPPTPIPTAGPASSRTSAPVRIVIPSISVDAPVVEVGWHVVWLEGEARGVWDTVAGAAGHHRGSADPGHSGNCVLSAHSSDAGGAVFRRLDELAEGDLVQLYNLDGMCYTYIVTTVFTVDETGATAAEKRQHATWLDPTDQPVLTLVTCWPAWAYTHRIIVRASLHVP